MALRSDPPSRQHGGEADVVFGSRYLRPDGALPLTINRVCVHLLNLMVLALYGQRVTDEATCYKAFRTRDVKAMDLNSSSARR